MAAISILLQDEIYDHLSTVMPTYFSNLGYDDPRIKKGKLQDSPQNVSASILIHLQHPREKEWKDEPLQSSVSGVGFTSGEAGRSSWGSYAGTTMSSGRIGGGKTWLRKLSVNIRQFFTQNEDRDTSSEIANQVVSKVVKELSTIAVDGIVDEFNERAVKIHIQDVRMREGGGPGTFIWNSWIYIVVETLNPNV